MHTHQLFYKILPYGFYHETSSRAAEAWRAILDIKTSPDPNSASRLAKSLSKGPLSLAVILPEVERAASMRELHLQRLRSLAGGHSHLIIEGKSELKRISYDNLSNITVTDGAEVVVERASVHSGDPLVRTIEYDIVVPLDVIMGVGIRVKR